VVSREGGVVRASEELMVSQPTISNQLKDPEASLGYCQARHRARRTE
jgi:DNA-binding transcriptional LysR family regulator